MNVRLGSQSADCVPAPLSTTTRSGTGGSSLLLASWKVLSIATLTTSGCVHAVKVALQRWNEFVQTVPPSETRIARIGPERSPRALNVRWTLPNVPLQLLVQVFDELAHL